MIDLYAPENWDTPLFPVAVVAQAATVPVATLRQWIVRYADDLKLWEPRSAKDGDIEKVLTSGAKADGDGFAHRFSLRGALHIAAAARLINKGATVKDAYMATTHWAHVGDMSQPAYWKGEPQPTVTRLPGGLFPKPAWTFLIHYSGDNARVVSVAPEGEALPFKFADLFAHGHPIYTPPTIVFLNMLDRYVRGVCEGYLSE